MTPTQQPQPADLTAAAVQAQQQALSFAQAQQAHALSAMQAQIQVLQIQEMQLFQMELLSKLQWLFGAVQQKFAAGSICVFQAWLPYGDATVNPDTWQLLAEPNLVIVGDPCFADFRLRSCQTPLHFKNSMPGRVWRTGAVQVVQNLKIVPPSLHPRSQLQENDLDRLAEVLYIPVYDQLRPARGPVAVLEVFMSARSPVAMLAADFLSFVGSAMGLINLSVSNPLPQPIRRSALSGRRARAPADDSSPDMSQHQVQQGTGGSGQGPAPEVHQGGGAASSSGAAGQGGAANPVGPPCHTGSSGPAQHHGRAASSSAGSGGEGAAPGCSDQQAAHTHVAVSAAADMEGSTGVISPHTGAGNNGTGSGSPPVLSSRITTSAGGPCSSSGAGPNSQQLYAAALAAAAAAGLPLPQQQQQQRPMYEGACDAGDELPRKVRKVDGQSLARSKSMHAVGDAALHQHQQRVLLQAQGQQQQEEQQHVEEEDEEGIEGDEGEADEEEDDEEGEEEGQEAEGEEAGGDEGGQGVFPQNQQPASGLDGPEGRASAAGQPAVQP